MNSEISITRDGHVTIVEMQRPPNNFIDEPLGRQLAQALESFDDDPQCRCVVLAAAGKHFCAGSDLAGRMEQAAPGEQGSLPPKHFYDHCDRLASTRKPLIAAIQGAAIGAGLGLALLADFRIASPQARLSANFTRQGYHPGFGLTFTLPRLIGEQRAAWMFYSGERVAGEDALHMGLVDRLAPIEELRDAALKMAAEIAGSGPRAVQETRASLRGDFSRRFAEALGRERVLQDALRLTEDYREGVLAMKERREPLFRNR
jgi:enoyl-CoA hydratase/carnithine racemase